MILNIFSIFSNNTKWNDSWIFFLPFRESKFSKKLFLCCIYWHNPFSNGIKWTSMSPPTKTWTGCAHYFCDNFVNLAWNFKFLCLNISEKCKEFIWSIYSLLQATHEETRKKTHWNKCKKTRIDLFKLDFLKIGSTNLFQDLHHWKEESLSFPTVYGTCVVHFFPYNTSGANRCTLSYSLRSKVPHTVY